MATFQKADADVVQLAQEIIKEFESHGPLIDAKVKVDLVMAFGERDEDTGELLSNALTKNGMPALGIARNIALKERVMGRGDAEVSLDGDWWSEATIRQRKALLDHELHHIQIKTKKGQFVYDDIGRPLIKLRKHDVEIGWFKAIADRHGSFSMEQIQAKAIMDSVGQYFWPELAPDHTKALAAGKKEK